MDTVKLLQDNTIDCDIIFCSTKCDLYEYTHDFPTSAYQTLKQQFQENNYDFFETSALKGINVDEVFYQAASICISKQKSFYIPHTEDTVDLTKKSSTKSSCF